MPHWVAPFKVRRSTQILNYAVRQNYELLSHGGEACFLLKRLRRSNEVFQLATRRTDTIDHTAAAGSYTVDPDTGMYRYKLWGALSNRVNQYPDIGTLTATVHVSGGGSTVWEPAVDKYSFISGADEYTFDIFANQLDSLGNELEDAVYVVFNTAPFDISNTIYFNYGNISPATEFESMQPRIDNQEGFQYSLFSFEQWRNSNARIRTLCAQNRFLLAYPGVLTDVTLTAGGFFRQSKADYWTVPPPYSPAIVEHDVVVRESTGQRFQVTNYTPIYLEDILVSQHLDMSELDPKSTIYNVEVDG